MAALCRAAVNPVGLQYVAHFRDTALLSSTDRFDEKSLSHLFVRISPEARRRMYAELGAQVPARAVDLSQAVRTLLPSTLERVVLDVEQGAIFIHHLIGEEFLLGVTLSQNRVATADRNHGPAHPGLPSIGGSELTWRRVDL